jgi:uncharacterized membrane protein
MTGAATYGFSKRRIKALTDSIYAVALTLLVIELKLPARNAVRDLAALISAVGHLLPKFIAWIISHLVLGLFWIGHHRMFHAVRNVDGKRGAMVIPWAAAGNMAFMLMMLTTPPSSRVTARAQQKTETNFLNT